MKVNTKLMSLALVLPICGVSGYLLYLLLKKCDKDLKTVEVPVHKHLLHWVTVKLIEKDTNTTITIKKTWFRNTAICVIRGLIEDCNLAATFINKLTSGGPATKGIDMYLGVEELDAVIGRENMKLKEIRLKSGAQVIPWRKKIGPLYLIMLRGTEDQLVVAKSLIDEVCRQFHKEREVVKAAEKSKVEVVEKTSLDAGKRDEHLLVYVQNSDSPSRFWVQICCKSDTLSDLMIAMKEYYEEEDNRISHILSKLSEGDLVVSSYQKNGKWYRAKVWSVDSDNSQFATLFYLDYGFLEERVHISDIYDLRTDFLKLQFQAIECFLARVDPVGKTWSKKAIERFKYLTRAPMKAKINGYCLREKLGTKRANSPVAGLELLDENLTFGPVDVAQELVRDGFAVFKKDAYVRSNSPVIINT